MSNSPAQVVRSHFRPVRWAVPYPYIVHGSLEFVTFLLNSMPSIKHEVELCNSISQLRDKYHIAIHAIAIRLCDAYKIHGMASAKLDSNFWLHFIFLCGVYEYGAECVRIGCVCVERWLSMPTKIDLLCRSIRCEMCPSPYEDRKPLPIYGVSGGACI